MKKIVCACLMLALLMPVLAFGASALSDASIAVNGFNAFRGENAIIVYDNSGFATGTNEWGYEVAVDESGIIVAVGGNNRVVPLNGFVISGHGTGAAFLRANAAIGRYARIFEQNMTLIISDKPVPPFYDFVIKADGFNSNRSENKLIVYTSGKTTGTNKWGYEVVADKTGRIISCGGNNNEIPEGGFVLSGHGSNAEILKLRLSLGMYASYDINAKSITVSYTIDSLMYYDGELVRNARILFESQVSSFALFDEKKAETMLLAVEKELAEAQAAYKLNNDADAYCEFSKRLALSLTGLMTVCVESFQSEYRGVWVRPTEKTRDEVHTLIEKLHGLGANAVCVETQYDCTTIFPAPKGSLFVQNPVFGRFDVLRAYIDECHAFGMELHLWLPVFYLGNTTSHNAGISVFKKRPDFFVKNQNGDIYAESGDTAMNIDPSNAEATQFLLDTYEYLLTEYDADCIQLDYIRYQGTGEYDWGYFSKASADYKEIYGTEPKYNRTSSGWAKWCEIRCGYVTDFVRRVSELRDRVSPSTLVSADVFPDMASSKTSIYQDCATWVARGYIDLLNPMLYGEGAPETYLSQFSEICEGKCALAPGLGTYISSMSKQKIFDQLLFCRAAGSLGTVAFEGNAFVRKYAEDYLTNGIYAAEAPAPSRSNAESAQVLIKTMEERAAVMKEKGAVTEAEKEALLNAFGKARDYIIVEGTKGVNAYKTLCKAISEINDNSAKEALQRDADVIKSLYFLDRDSQYRIDTDKKLLFVSSGATKDALEKMFAASGEIVTDINSTAATGNKITVTLNGVRTELSVVVAGDVNGDGVVTVVDYSMIKRMVLGTYSLSGAFLHAARVSGGENVTTADYAMVKRNVLGTFDLNK